MINTATLERGNVYLIRNFGDDWFQRIDLDTLDMDQRYHCVYGQLQGRFSIMEADLDKAISYGFYAPWNTLDTAEWYKQATDNWKVYIQMRREVQS